MFPIRIKACSESDLRMLGNLARNIQRVLPVTQADIDAAAALGKGWVVWKVVEVNDPIDNLRGGTQLVIKQNSVQPGQNVRRVLIVSGPGGETVVIGPGMSPLLLPDAIANSLSYVKAFGGTEQNGTPTSDAPVDIVSNNGVLKARHQSGLPLGYTLLDYIESSGTQYIDTGVTASNDMKGEIRGKFLSVDTTSAHLLSARKGTQGYNTMIAWNSNDGGGYFTQFASGLAYTRVVMPKDTNIHILQDVVTPTSTSTYVDSSVNTISAENVGYNLNLYINARNIDGTSVSDISTYRYYYVKIWESGTLVRDFVPAKNASNVVGMYDLVSGQFFTNAGTGDFTAGDPVSDPVEIYTDGTVETINAHGKNLFDQSTATRYRTSWTNSGDGSWQAVSSSSVAVAYGSYVKPNTTYTLSKKGGSRLIITGYRTKTEPSSSQSTPADYKIRTDTAEVIDGSYTFTTPADCTWILFGLRQNNSTPTFPYDVQLEQGSTATEYEPYYDGGTATAEMLLKVGDYKDVQSILDGVVTRNVGVKVLDGTEDWRNISGYYNISKTDLGTDSTVLPAATTDIICTHYETISGVPDRTSVNVGGSYVNFRDDNISTLAGWKQWLADQYAAGTPVIVLYPLATPTTESVTGQTLQVQGGDNTLEITQASLTGLELEAEYTKVA